MFAHFVETLYLPCAICLCLSQPKMIHTIFWLCPLYKVCTLLFAAFYDWGTDRRYTAGQAVHTMSPAVLCFFTVQYILHNVIQTSVTLKFIFNALPLHVSW